MEKQRRLRVTLVGREVEFGRARDAEATFKEGVILDQGLKGRVDFLYRMGKEREIQPEDGDQWATLTKLLNLCKLSVKL